MHRLSDPTGRDQQMKRAAGGWRRSVAASVVGMGLLWGRNGRRRRRPSSWCTPRSKPIRSRPTKRPSMRRFPTSTIKMGPRFDGHHHGEAARRESESAGRHGRRDLGVEPRGVRQRWNAAGLRAEGLDKIQPQYRDPKNPPRVGRDGRLRCRGLLQHGRGAPSRTCRSPNRGRTSPSRSTRAGS